MLKKNLSDIIIIGIALTVLLVPEARALVSQGLMKFGLYQPKFEKVDTASSSSNSYSDFEISDSDGNIINLGKLEGKVIFINFWATWCPPCIAEMPSIQKLHDKFKNDSEVIILTIETDKDPEKAARFMEKRKFDIPVYTPVSFIPKDLFNGTLPTTVILDKKGNKAHTTLGMADYSGQDIVDFLNEVKSMH